MHGIASYRNGIQGSSLHLMSGAKTAGGDSDGQGSPGAQPRRDRRSTDRVENDRPHRTADRAELVALDPAALQSRMREWFGDAANGVLKVDGTVDFAKVHVLMSQQRSHAGGTSPRILNLAA